MNILLIVGNGFDLNLGLPTSYQDFLKYYLTTNPLHPSPHVRKLKEMIQNEGEQWSDLEKQLGVTTAKFEKAKDFIDAFRDIREELAEYLRAVDKLPIPSIKDVAEKIKFDLYNLSDLFDLPQKHKYERFLKDKNMEGGTEVNVISFNYTSSFERLMAEMQHSVKPQKDLTINTPVHIHGTLDEGLLMGVNDASQIANTGFRNGYLVGDLFIKPLINKEWEDGIDTRCREMISQADIIILYGLSIGATDRMWWQEIVNSANYDIQLLAYSPYDMTQPTVRKDEILVQNKLLCSELCEKMDVAPTIHTTIFNKTLPIRQNRLFHFDIGDQVREDNYKKVLDELIETF